jgi:hypothetical protein
MEYRNSKIGGRRNGVAVVRTVAIAIVVACLPSVGYGQFTISVPDNLIANPGETINIPVNFAITGNQLDSANGNGIGAVSFVITFNPSLASNVGTFSLGTLIADPAFGFSNYTTNNTEGLIRAVTSSTQGTPGLPAGTTGSLATIPFTISPTAAPGNYSFDFLASSGFTTTSIVDNNFTTYEVGPVLIFSSGSLTVVPEPGSLLAIGLTAATVWIKVTRRKNGRSHSFGREIRSS